MSASSLAPTRCNLVSQADGGCWSSTLTRAGVFTSVSVAKTALDAQIDPVLAEFRSGGRPNATREEAGVNGETWHARVIDKAAWQAGFRMSKLLINPTHPHKVDLLRDVLKEGTYAIEGIQNKVWYHGKTKVDLWGKDVRGPDKVPSEWRHVVCVKDGKVLDWEHDDNGTRHADGGAKPLSVLWLRAGNTVHVTKGYFRSILKVYTITPRSPAAGFKRSRKAVGYE